MRAATAERKPRGWAVPISEGNSYRALDAALITLVHFDGNVWLPARAPDLIDGLLLVCTDPGDTTDINGAVISSSAEVNSAYI